MSCPNSTSPIDINLSTISGKCDLKCDYSFKYYISSCIATNRADYISLSYDSSSSPPVLYNSSGYNVKEVRIYTPSLHSYAGTKTDAELIIIHNSNTGAKDLLVCIPIKMNNSSTISALLFQSIISTMSNNAPSDGESTTVNVSNYNLDSIVPRKPFFSYTATEPYQPCTANVDLIVYSPLNASLDISQDTLNQLNAIISSNPYDIKTGPLLFYNEKGPSEYGSSGGQIYIDCQPVGQSDTTEQVVTSNSSGTIDFNNLLSNPTFKLILGSLIFVLLLFLLSHLLGLLKPAKTGGSITETVLTGGAKKMCCKSVGGFL